MQRDLSRLADRAHEQTQRRERHDPRWRVMQRPGSATRTEAFLQRCEADLAVARREQRQDTNHEAEVTDAIGEEGLLRRLSRRGFLEPVTDEQVGTQAHQLPEHEHHDEVVRQHDAGHGEHEHAKATEEAALRFVLAHVAQRIHVHQQADEGDDEHHARALLIQDETDVCAQARHINEGQDRAGHWLRTEQDAAGDKADESRGDGDGLAHEVPDEALEHQDRERGEQRQQQDERYSGLLIHVVLSLAVWSRIPR